MTEYEMIFVMLLFWFSSLDVEQVVGTQKELDVGQERDRNVEGQQSQDQSWSRLHYETSCNQNHSLPSERSKKWGSFQSTSPSNELAFLYGKR